MNLFPPHLQKGDTIAIVAPAKAIEKHLVEKAISFFEEQGLHVIVGENCLKQHHYFSGTILERLSDFQSALDNPSVKAIICARGGYGCVQLVDRIQWAAQLREPKWIVGFSDITVLHQRSLSMGVPVIHGSMPLNFEENTTLALRTLIKALKGGNYIIKTDNNPSNKLGIATGKLVGGNLSILYSLLGTDDQISYSGTILFIEDLAEQIYHLDRMFHAFEKAGVLDRIKGLIVGGMTDLKDTAVPFGMSYEEVILSHFEYRRIPIGFDFPVGHINDNQALILGKDVMFTVEKSGSTLKYL